VLITYSGRGQGVLKLVRSLINSRIFAELHSPPQKAIILNKRKNGHIIAEKPGKDHLNQMIKVEISGQITVERHETNTKGRTHLTNTGLHHRKCQDHKRKRNWLISGSTRRPHQPNPTQGQGQQYLLACNTNSQIRVRLAELGNSILSAFPDSVNNVVREFHY
jgi:hypothetical protein